MAYKFVYCEIPRHQHILALIIQFNLLVCCRVVKLLRGLLEDEMLGPT